VKNGFEDGFKIPPIEVVFKKHQKSLLFETISIGGILKCRWKRKFKKKVL